MSQALIFILKGNITEKISLESLLFLNSTIQLSFADSAKFTDSESPHSQANVLKTGSENQPRVERSVDNQMLNREDSWIDSKNECQTATVASGDQCIGEKSANETDKIAVSTLSGDSAFMRVIPYKNVVQNDKRDVKQKKRQVSNMLND
jgi:hypothetical protein